VLKLHEVRDKALLRFLHLPGGMLRRISGGTTTIEGRTLDVQAQTFCFLASRFAPHVADMTPEGVRRQANEDGPLVNGAIRPVRGIRELDLGDGVRARWYLPYGAPEPCPLVVYIHGGGFVSGSIVSHDNVARIIADEGRVAVLSIEYRLAPEHKFPAAVDDAIRAYQWARDNAAMLGCDPARIAVAGDSAGGNLSAVVSRAARDRGFPMPALQVLIYPATDFTRSLPSHTTFAKGFFLDARSIDYYLGHYAADPKDERASPLLAKTFDRLPRAIVVTSGFDPLVDEGDAYAEKLKSAGVEVTHIRHDSLIHGFVNMMGAIDAGRLALVDLARQIRVALA
jgi:acetyl esterase